MSDNSSGDDDDDDDDDDDVLFSTSHMERCHENNHTITL